MLANNKIPPRFKLAYKTLQNLKDYNDFSGVFIFGSAAREELDLCSDLDVVVIVNKINHICTEISHPIIKGVKFDISFSTIEDTTKFYESEVKTREKIPMIAESIIVFDKSGKLTELKKRSVKIKPLKLKINDHQSIQYMTYHIIQNAKKLSDIDPESSLLTMNIDLKDLLKFHYKIRRKWWKSNKRVLNDLRKWDPTLAVLVEDFVSETGAKRKFIILQSIVLHILNPIGGYKDISEMRYYHCFSCKRYLDFLQ